MPTWIYPMFFRNARFATESRMLRTNVAPVAKIWIAPKNRKEPNTGFSIPLRMGNNIDRSWEIPSNWLHDTPLRKGRKPGPTKKVEISDEDEYNKKTNKRRPIAYRKIKLCLEWLRIYKELITKRII